MTEDEIVGWHHRHNGHESEQTPGDRRGEGSLACCSPRGCKESDTTERLNWTISFGGFPCGSVVKNPPAMQEMQVRSLRRKNPLEEEMAILSSILAWRIPWREEPGGLHSIESQRVGQDWATNIFSFMYYIMLYNTYIKRERAESLLYTNPLTFLLVPQSELHFTEAWYTVLDVSHFTVSETWENKSRKWIRQRNRN